MRGRFIAATLAVVTGLLVRGASQSSEREDAPSWFLKVRQQVHNAIMPLTVPDVLVAYRASDDMKSDSREGYFAIQYVTFGVKAPDLVRATVVLPIGASIHKQLVDLRTKDPRASLTDLISRLALRKETVYVDACPAILMQLDLLAQSRLSIPRRDVIALDTPIHEFVLALPQLEMTAKTQVDDDPLVRWAARTHDALMRCLPSR